MPLKKAVILNRPPQEDQKKFIESFAFDTVFIARHVNQLKSIQLRSDNFISFESDIELVSLLEKEKPDVCILFGSADWAPPLPQASLRWLSDFMETQSGLSEQQKGNFFRRSDAFLMRGSKEAWLQTIPANATPTFIELKSNLEFTNAWLETICETAVGRKIPASIKEDIRFQIVTPSFNHAAYIERTILSVVNQTYTNFSYLVVDGKSRDNTTEILKRYEDQLSWISEKDKGYADAVNKGLLNKPADYYLWLPSDDLFYDENTLARMAQTIQETRADVVYSEAVYCDESDKTVSLYQTHEFSHEILKENCFVCQPATAFSAKAFNLVGGLDTRLKSIADYDLWLKFADAGLVFARAGFLSARYRLQPDSITVSQRKTTYKEIFELQLHRYGKVGRSWIVGAIHEIAKQSPANPPQPAVQSASTETRPSLQRRILKKVKSKCRALLFRYATEMPVVQWMLLVYLKRIA